MLTVMDRVRRIDRITKQYEASSGNDPKDVISDLLADMLLWCMAHQVDFQEVLRLGRMHARAEWDEATHWAGLTPEASKRTRAPVD